MPLVKARQHTSISIYDISENNCFLIRMIVSKLLTLNFNYAVAYANPLIIILSVFSSIKIACCNMTAGEIPVLVVNYELSLSNFNPQSDLFLLHSVLSSDVLANEL